jgi:2-keto-3-deoxy-L-rhamnonate aldolase RhmA
MSHHSPFSLTLFCTDLAFVRAVVAAGVDEIIVDWERIGKESRQSGFDTEINADTLDDLVRVRAATTARVVCRLNRFGPWTPGEVEEAIGGGADEILLPMVRSCDEPAAVIRQARGRCGVGILVETVEAVREADALGRLPLSRVYVGLNDLAIDRGLTNLFVSVIDGTVERVRRAFEVPFGFGGLTLPERGAPIPCRLLIAEMARLETRFTFLRRSFRRDVVGRDLRLEVPRIHEALAGARLRTPSAVERDREELWQAVTCLAGMAALQSVTSGLGAATGV